MTSDAKSLAEAVNRASAWPSVEDQLAWQEAPCTCQMVDPGSTGPDTQPPDIEQDPFCPKHPHLPIVLGALARVLDLARPS